MDGIANTVTYINLGRRWAENVTHFYYMFVGPSP